MANIIVKQTNSGGTIQEMSATDKDYLEHVLLTDFYSSDTGSGTLSVNPSDATGLTNIGTITDTRGGAAPGAHPVGTSVTTVTYTFYQDLRSASESVAAATRPLMVDSTTNLKRMPSTNVNSDFIASTQNNLVNSGVGMYKLQPSAPTDGTWVSKSTITNLLSNATNTTYKLWRKSQPASTPTTVRPLKFSTQTIQEMTDTEIKQFTARLKNRIRVGVGQYKVQATAPDSGGTWAIAGSAFLDTRYALANQTYSTAFSNTFQGTFTNTFAGFFSASYARIEAFTGSNLGNFAGSRTKFFTGSFTGFFTGFFTGNFTGLTVQSSQQTISTKYLWVRTA